MKVFCLNCLVLLLFGCTKEINIELPVKEPKIVVNSLFSDDTQVSVFIFKTRTPFDEKEFLIENANVLLYTGNTTDTLQYMGEGIYTSNLLSKVNTEYQLEVKANGFEKVTTRDYIPNQIPQPVISSFKDSIGVDEEGYYYSQFTISFIDNANEKNYYEVFIEHLLFEDEIWSRNCFSKDLIIAYEGLNNYHPNTIIFSDDFINGIEKELSINYYPVTYGNPTGGQGELVDTNYKVIVHFRSISESYYKYKKRLVVHLAGQEFDFWAGSGEPVQMFSNVEGGYGIFAGYTEKVDTIQKFK